MIRKILLEHSQNEYGVPFFTPEEWQSFCIEHQTEGESKSGIDKILPEFQKIINEQSSSLPIRNITQDEMIKSFHSLCLYNPSSAIIPFTPEEISDKFEDNNYRISRLIKCHSAYNAASNYFQIQNRYKCGHHTVQSSKDRWFSDDYNTLKKLLVYLWRSPKDPLDISKYMAMFRLNGYVATQFKPTVAKFVYETYNAKNIIDMSCGWGDRLVAFYASNNTKRYIGCDPSTDVYETYKTQCLFYEDLLNVGLFPTEVQFNEHDDWFEVIGNKHVIIFNRPAEDIDWVQVSGKERNDLMFSSPPYFATERYGENEKLVDNQSWKRYTEYQEWRNNFLFKVIDNISDCTDIVLINIVDSVINNERQRIVEDIIHKYDVTEIDGMVLKRRPSKSQQRIKHFIEPILRIK